MSGAADGIFFVCLWLVCLRWKPGAGWEEFTAGVSSLPTLTYNYINAHAHTKYKWCFIHSHAVIGIPTFLSVWHPTQWSATGRHTHTGIKTNQTNKMWDLVNMLIPFTTYMRKAKKRNEGGGKEDAVVTIISPPQNLLPFWTLQIKTCLPDEKSYITR